MLGGMSSEDEQGGGVHILLVVRRRERIEYNEMKGRRLEARWRAPALEQVMKTAGKTQVMNAI